jgi:hypothetical protein
MELRAAAITRLRLQPFDTRWRHTLHFADALLANRPLRDTLSLHALRELAVSLPSAGLREIAARAASPALSLRPLGDWQYVQPWTIGVDDEVHRLDSSHDGLSLIWLALRDPGEPIDAAALLGRRTPKGYPHTTRREREAWYLERAGSCRHSASVNARHVLDAAIRAIDVIAPPLADAMEFRVSREAMVRYVGGVRITT